MYRMIFVDICIMFIVLYNTERRFWSLGFFGQWQGWSLKFSRVSAKSGPLSVKSQ